MKKNVLKITALLTICLVLIMGCGKNYGDALFTCDSKNMIGLEGVYIKDETLTIKINTGNDMSDEDPYTSLEAIFKNGKLESGEVIRVIGSGAAVYTLEKDDVTVNSGAKTISFVLEDCDPDTIKRIRISGDGFLYAIDIENEELQAMFSEGDNQGWYVQCYLSSGWDEVEKRSDADGANS